MSNLEKVEQFYNKNYKILMFIPIILLVISLGLIINQYVQTGYVIEVSDLSEEQLKEKLTNTFGIELNDDNFSIEETGKALGESFYKELLIALAFAFVFMAIVVFISFKTFVPSLGVIQAAFSDIVITLAIVNLIGVKISTAGIAAFLLMLGYSIDSDI